MRLHTQKDIENEDRIAAILRDKWTCSFNRYPQMHFVDWFISKNDALSAVAELKCRNVDRNEYPTLYLSFAKWYHLMNCHATMGCEALVIYGMNDCILYSSVRHICPERPRILGRTDRPGVVTDMEPIIEVPVRKFTMIEYPQEQTAEEWLGEYEAAASKG